MQQTFRKMKRVQPLLKVRKNTVDEQTSILLAIREEKQNVVKEMRESQQKYMKGVEDLNRIRASQDRSNLATLEEALDAVKIHWYTLFKRVQEVENKEKEQVNRLLSAEKDLKAIENLEDKYTREFQKDLARNEQKSLDDLAVRRHSRRDP